MRWPQNGRANLAISAVVIGALAAWTSASIGQQTRTAPRGADRNEAAARQDNPEHFDHHVAQCLMLENRNEVAAARIAEKKGNSAEVKNFAQIMVKDREQFSSDLQKFAGEQHRDRDNRAAAPGAARTGPADRTAPAARAPGGHEGEHHAHVAKYMKIREEIADQCRASMQRELDSKQGNKFDECYMGLQIAAHMKMVDELTVLAKHVSPDFKPVLDKGLQTAQRHLDDAKQVMKDINNPQTAEAKDKETK